MTGTSDDSSMPGFDQKREGAYLGTDMNEKWWRRFTGLKMFARGNGKFWLEGDSVNFHRYLTKKPLVLPFSVIEGFKIGKWHCGKWGGGHPILKILWNHEGKKLSSGFLFTRDSQEVQQLIDHISSIKISGQENE